MLHNRLSVRAMQIAFAAFCTTLVIFLVLPSSGRSAEDAEVVRILTAHEWGKSLTIDVQVETRAKRAATVVAELIGPRGEVLRQIEKTLPAGASQKIQFAFTRTLLHPDSVLVRCRAGRASYEVGLGQILLSRAHETTLTAPEAMWAGSRVVLHCDVRGVRSITRTVGLPASIVVRLESPDKTVRPLFSGKTNDRGEANVGFKVPEVPAGPYVLEVVTKSTVGEETLRHPVKILSSARVLLTTDKPLYQPGQTMHLRTLALRSFDLAPVGKASLTLEIEDGKGNKVFKKALRTSEFGIASADFTLADEVNMGDYRIRAILGEHHAEKTVAVKRYVLPKFTTEMKMEKGFYLPGQTIFGRVQADYHFGKPVTGATVEIKASVSGSTIRKFAIWKGKTSSTGRVAFNVQVPASLARQALAKGTASVLLEARITDTADHAETVTRSYPLSDRPIRISVIPEGGRVVPGLENRIFIATTYPDGKPAKCRINLWQGSVPRDKATLSVQTSDAGVAEVRWTPEVKDFRAGTPKAGVIESVVSTDQTFLQTDFFDLCVRASDSRGNRASTVAELTASTSGENVVLRLDRAICNGGEPVRFAIQTSSGLPAVNLEVIKAGQPVLLRRLTAVNGGISGKVDLPPDVFGTLEVHAYQVLSTGRILRDARVIYVTRSNDLKVSLDADAPVYRCGAEGTLRFQVTDEAGVPTPAALGVLIVDEAVYALHEVQPGLEKAFFTLQRELVDPPAGGEFRPADGMDALVRKPELTPERQQIARALLAGIQPPRHPRWYVSPETVRRQKVQTTITGLGSAVFYHALQRATVVSPKGNDGVRFLPGLLDQVSQGTLLGFGNNFTDPLGGQLNLERLANLEPDFSAARLAEMVTLYRMEGLVAPLQDRHEKRRKWFTEGTDVLLDRMLTEAALLTPYGEVARKDGWGRNMRLVKRTLGDRKTTGIPRLLRFTLVSAGPDGKFGTKDDVFYEPIDVVQMASHWWESDAPRTLRVVPEEEFRFRSKFGMRWSYHGFWGPQFRGARNLGGLAALGGGFGALGGGLGALGGGALGGGALGGGLGALGGGALGALGGGALGGALGGGALGGRPGFPPMPIAKVGDVRKKAPGTPAAAQARMREYFPETLLWQPSLITDDHGRATLKVPFADSITTWRLTASASSRSGALGGVSAPLRVFQDFFVDLDLPVALTQNDEIAFPVAVYNYLKTAQTVTLELEESPWFTLADGLGRKRTLKLEPNQVTSVKFRIRARKVGHFPLTVHAKGLKTSDAIRRRIEVLPDGTPVEQVYSDKLTGTVKHTITLPAYAIEGASRLLVKIHPGVQSQLLEGVEGMLRMPYGCFEQTSSAAYPNILAMHYLKKNRPADQTAQMRAEQFLNASYQRLLTFERPGGGFDLWGKGPPVVWLSAYGLWEFTDMAKVYPVDPRIIARTHAWLMKQQGADGTWTQGGQNKGEGDEKLKLTSYVAWVLLESMAKPDAGKQNPDHEKIRKAIQYIREQIVKADDAYALALAANALAAWDSEDKATLETLQAVLRKLDGKKERKPYRAVCFPSAGESLCWARGEYLTVETTALAALAMSKSGRFTNTVNEALTYLTKSRDGNGTWGTTQGTILALKALLAGAGAPVPKDSPIVIQVNGKKAADVKVTEANADVMQQFDLREHLKTGVNEVTIAVKGETGLTYQIVGRHFAPHAKKADPDKEGLALALAYDRTKLTTADVLKAKATLKYNGKVPAGQMIVELPIPPGFTVDPDDFTKLLTAGSVKRFSVTSRQVTLYIDGMKAGSEHLFAYVLKPKYPLAAKAPAAMAYEYYTPSNRVTTRPAALVVEEKK